MMNTALKLQFLTPVVSSGALELGGGAGCLVASLTLFSSSSVREMLHVTCQPAIATPCLLWIT